MSATNLLQREPRGSIFSLLLIGLVFHLVFIGTVFDCYFTSPVVNGMKRFGEERVGGKRLVLIVGDGLRADLLLSLSPFPTIPESPHVVAPFLRQVVETRGAFGVSHTHVPTESRPGHVAIIGGMYEDVSAVTKGWKTNPVDFDSVFNQSSHTFSFGSPDILPMFADGATNGKVDTWCYHEDEEDFTKDATALDVWVLEHLRQLFHNATSNPELDKQLRGDQTVFFLHLLGLDTTGHSYRPHSKEYMNNIQVVDEIVRQTEELFTEFYKDAETSFIFTADHGMSKIGNHGDGDPDNTRTPLIAWGAGVRGPLPSSTISIPTHDEYSAPWGLNHLVRHDMEQADIAALMSTLLGIEWPVNSVGVLPDLNQNYEQGYLNLGEEGNQRKAKVGLVNAKVILEHYRVKHELKKQHAIFYKPFKALAPPGHLKLQELYPGEQFVREIESLIQEQQYEYATIKESILIRKSLEGLRYLETYDRTLIRTIVTISYIGWIAFGAVNIFPQFTSTSQHQGGSRAAINIVTGLSVTVSYLLFFIQHSPWSFYIYILFPIYFWYRVSVTLSGYLGQLKTSNTPLLDTKTFACWVVQAVVVVIALESMVVSYTHRSIWSLGFVTIGYIWPLMSWPAKVRKERFGLWLAWMCSCTATGVFPLLGVDKQENIPLILAGGLCMLAGGISGIIKSPKDNMTLKLLLSAQVCFLLTTIRLLSMLITASSTSNLRAKLGLPLSNQIAGWTVLVASSVLPFAVNVNYPTAMFKITSLFLDFSVCFVILSISIEGLFYTSFAACLVCWIEVEDSLRDRSPSKTKHYQFRADDLRIAIFFLFFVQVAFFGTGNVASISSFYLEPVYRLVPIFSPFLMAALLIFKIVAPYIILSAAFATLNNRLDLPPFSLFLVALTLTDVMTMTFFFNVTDTGSWLEIGQTISFFCISSLLLVWSAGICALGEVLMGHGVLQRIKSE
ncbi:PigN-domain-containing protein [Abortiporus biennis]|nr:PigN-domain-containing protein [Abortiporus biennis]